MRFLLPLLLVAKTLSSYTAPDVRVPEVTLNIDIGPRFVTVQNEMSVIPLTGHSTPLVLDGNQLKLQSIAINGKHLSPEEYSMDEVSLTIHSPPSTLFTLDIETRLSPEANEACIGLYTSENALLTKCEPQGFRNITYFVDRPDILSFYTVTLTADKELYPVLLSNGDLTEETDLPNGRHSCTWVDTFQKPSYLFAIVAGDLELVEDTFITQSGKEVLIQCYVDPGECNRVEFGLECLKKAMAWDEEVYGREYDLDTLKTYATKRYAVGGSASENKSLLIFDSQYFLSDEHDSDQKRRKINEVVSHEYLHNWTGNRITIRDWLQLGFKEGLTCFRGAQYMEDQYGASSQRIQTVARLLSGPYEQHCVLPDQADNVSDLYTATTYRKAPELFRMLFQLLGERQWRLAMDLFFERFDQDYCSVKSFLELIEETSSKPMNQFIRWFQQEHAPKLDVKFSYKQKTRRVTLQVKQQGNGLFLLPFKVAFIDTQGNPVECRYKSETSHEHLIPINQPDTTLHFDGIDVAVVPSLLRGLSAPAQLDYPYTEDDLYILFEFDTDPVNRWLAAKELVKDGMTLRWQEVIQRMMQNQDEDQGVVSECLKLLTGQERLQLEES